jgi:Domain of unknown function (DUF2357).
MDPRFFLVHFDNPTDPLIMERIKKVFASEEFTSTSEVRNYFSSNKKEQDFISKYDNIYSLVDFFSELYDKAQKTNAENDYADVISPKKALPISYDSIYETFRFLDERNAPPVRLITKIAETEIQTISNTISHIHRILERRREMVPVGRVQQIDTQCIRWLTKQPGRNMAEKAGTRQKILALIRDEKTNTLENQVLKAFLKLIITNCDSYLHSFASEFKGHPRILAVKKLRAMAQGTLESQEFSSISNLYSLQKPNYVLQNNPGYRTIWVLYKQLLSRVKLIETVWANRHKVVCDYLMMTLYVLNDHYLGDKKRLHHYFWIYEYPTDGRFLDDNDWRYFGHDINAGHSFFQVKKKDCCLIKYSNSNKAYNVDFYYIPDGNGTIVTNAFDSDYRHIVYNENGNCKLLIPSSSKNLIINAESDTDNEFVVDVFMKMKEFFR